MMVESGASAALSLHSVVSASCRSQLASCPEQFFDEQPPSSALAASASMGALQKVTNPRSAHDLCLKCTRPFQYALSRKVNIEDDCVMICVCHGRRSRPALMAVYYKLDGQEGVCGPLSIDRESHGMQEVAVRTARSSGLTRIHLAFDVSSMRNGEPAVVLHSGVQVRHSISLLAMLPCLESKKIVACNMQWMQISTRAVLVVNNSHDDCCMLVLLA